MSPIGQIMNEDNPPMAMPNGHVYSLRALRTLARESLPNGSPNGSPDGVNGIIDRGEDPETSNEASAQWSAGPSAVPSTGPLEDRMIQCPRTGAAFTLKDLRKIFVL